MKLIKNRKQNSPVEALLLVHQIDAIHFAHAVDKHLEWAVRLERTGITDHDEFVFCTCYGHC